MKHARFPLAPMTTDLRIVTVIVLVIPLVMGVVVAFAPSPVDLVIGGTATFIALLYAGVWLWGRPSAFEAGKGEVVIRWPMRTRVIADITDAVIIDRAAFRAQFGLGARVGAGGLWGGFGLLVTRRETFGLWVSRTDRWVLVTPRAGRRVLLTPMDPERFVDAVKG
jgi:hypothetical protein